MGVNWEGEGRYEEVLIDTREEVDGKDLFRGLNG